jgi:hypothetical protein
VPRRLLDRCQSDSIREFRAAARQRFDDALALSAARRRTAAIYLWGYAAEMIVKAAYFSFIGLGEADTITWPAHLRPAIDKGRSLGIFWPRRGEGHNVRAWAELLIAERASTLAAAYPSPFDTAVQVYGQRIEYGWNEILRYHKNYAYLYEVRNVREAAEWFLVNSPEL